MYLRVAELTSTEEWPAKRRELHRFLEEDGRSQLLLEILLEEGELGAAVNLAVASPDVPSFAVAVAERLEEDPEQAIRLYRLAVEATISRFPSRPEYRRVAKVLDRLEPLYSKAGRPAEFFSYVEELRQTHRRRRAFLDELRHFSRPS